MKNRMKLKFTTKIDGFLRMLIKICISCMHFNEISQNLPMDDHHLNKNLPYMDGCHLRYMEKIPEKTLLKFLQKQFGKISQYGNKKKMVLKENLLKLWKNFTNLSFNHKIDYYYFKLKKRKTTPFFHEELRGLK